MTDTIDRFESWLQKEGYRPRYVVKTVTDVRTLKARGACPETDDLRRVSDYRRAWRLYAEWCAEAGKRVDVEEPAKPELNARRMRLRKKRDEQAREQVEAWDLGEFRRLLAAIEKDETLEAAVLDVMANTALRIADVLRITLRQLREAHEREDGLISSVVVKGGKKAKVVVSGAPVQWSRLLSWGKRLGRADQNIAAALTGDPDPEAGSAAYQRVRTRLQRLGRLAKVSGRVHLHRLRHTVTVMAQRAGVPDHEIQHVLIHDDLQTTGIYTEHQAEIAAAALRKMRAFITSGDR